MERYFLDTENWHGTETDETGTMCAGDLDIRKSAVRFLTKLAAELLPRDGDVMHMAVHVRAEDGTPILPATLDFAIDRNAYGDGRLLSNLPLMS
jgi:hypothetical protein